MASFNQPVVFDNGSGVLKAGVAGEEHPKCMIPNIVGRVKHTRVMAGGKLEGDTFIGPKAEEFRGLLRIRYPMEHGIVTNWDDMEKVWNYVYTQELKIHSEEHSVLLTEPAFNSKRNKDRTAQTFFETFNVPGIHFAIQAVLSLYSSGRTTGIVLDSGDGVTHAVPVFEGFTVSNAIRRNDVAGRDVTEHLQLLLRKSGYRFVSSAEKEIVRTIKEKQCTLLLNPNKEIKDQQGRPVDYTLPDGNIIKLGPERFIAPEILFNPELIGDESPGVHELVRESIFKTDIDLRQELFNNIYLAGGSTMFKGFGDRFLQEITKVAPKDTKIKIVAPPERKQSAWIGGEILASLSTFKKIQISAADYKEDPDIIHKKSF